MGVQGLWVLLEPVGRRVNIEALTNKRLAIGELSPLFMIGCTLRLGQMLIARFAESRHGRTLLTCSRTRTSNSASICPHRPTELYSKAVAVLSTDSCIKP